MIAHMFALALLHAPLAAVAPSGPTVGDDASAAWFIVSPVANRRQIVGGHDMSSVSVNFRSETGRAALIPMLQAELGEQSLPSDAGDKRIRALTNLTASRLASALGPTWRIEASPDNEHISLRGPLAGGERFALVDRAVNDAAKEAASMLHAEALPPGPARDAAAASAKSAGAQLEASLPPIRIETRIFDLSAASGEDVAAALKTAIPWGSFAQVGGTQLVANATAAELRVAEELIGSLDEKAMRRAIAERERVVHPSFDSPARRILAKPINVDFKGGLISEYLALLGQAAGSESWALEDARDESIQLPPVKLTGVTADSALRLLDGLGISGADPLARRGVISVKRIDARPENDGAPPIYRIAAIYPDDQREPGQPAPAPPTGTEVFDVSRQGSEGGLSEEEIAEAQTSLLAALETGASMMGPSKSFKVKLHAPTGMLFVSGTPAEIGLASTIVNQWESRR